MFIVFQAYLFRVPGMGGPICGHFVSGFQTTKSYNKRQNSTYYFNLQR
jgi:hypothetical protein